MLSWFRQSSQSVCGIYSISMFRYICNDAKQVLKVLQNVTIKWLLLLIYHAIILLNRANS